jgi:hypothetical protein
MAVLQLMKMKIVLDVQTAITWTPPADALLCQVIVCQVMQMEIVWHVQRGTH